MKKIILFLIILLSALSLTAQDRDQRKDGVYSTAPDFFLDILNYRSDEQGKTKVDVFIQLPYTNIQFIKKDNAFIAEYEVTLTLYDEDKDDILQNKIWDEKVTADNFNQTLSKGNYNLSMKTFQVEPGKYLLRCIVEDKNSSRNVTTEHKMEVLDLSSPLAISDIMLVSEVVETGTGKRIVPNVSQAIQSMDKIIQFYYQVYSDSARDMEITYTIHDKNKDQNFSHSINEKIKKGTNELFGKLEYPSFTFGEYELLVQLKDTTGESLEGIGKTFYAQVIGMPRSITDLDKAIDQMIYIAPSSELGKIKDADNFEDKLNLYLDYWKAQDPTPATPLNEVMLEYYRRVQYANNNFTAYGRDGWRTDMGMVYITLGPPDYVERHPFELDSKPYEVWDYNNLNRRFVFVDYSGFGDYRLVNNDFRNWNRYRY